MSAGPALEDRRLTGIAMMMGAFFCFTVIDTSAKWLVESGMPALEAVFVRYFVHLAIVFFVIISLEGRDAFRTERPGAQLLRGAFLLASTVFNFTSVKYLPLTLTSAIFFTIPLWVCVLSIPFLGERVGPRRWAAILVGFGGVLIVTRPWSGEAHWAVILSIGAAVSASLYAILTRRLAGLESTATQQFYAAFIATLGIAPFALSDWHWPAAPIDWLPFAIIGVFGWLGHQLMTIAHRFAPATTLAPFVYVQIVYMTASSWIIFHTAPDIWVLVGAGVVLASGLYIWLRERQLSRPGVHPPKHG